MMHLKDYHAFYRALVRSGKTERLFATGIEYLAERIEEKIAASGSHGANLAVPAAVCAHYLSLQIFGLVAQARQFTCEDVLALPTMSQYTTLECISNTLGGNLMSSKRRHEVIETAVKTVTEHLRDSEVGERLSKLPSGDPRLTSRPSGPPSTWPDFSLYVRLFSR